jgi:hypothetical protein
MVTSRPPGLEHAPGAIERLPSDPIEYYVDLPRSIFKARCAVVDHFVRAKRCDQFQKLFTCIAFIFKSQVIENGSGVADF